MNKFKCDTELNGISAVLQLLNVETQICLLQGTNFCEKILFHYFFLLFNVRQVLFSRRNQLQIFREN